MAKQLCEAIKELRQLVNELKALPRIEGWMHRPEIGRPTITSPSEKLAVIAASYVDGITARADAVFDAVNESLPEYFRK